MQYDKRSLIRETPKLHNPIFLTNPSLTSSSIAAQVSDIGTLSSTMHGTGYSGSNITHSGGYNYSKGTNLVAMGK